MSLIYAALSFIVHAIGLKLSVDVLGNRFTENNFGLALRLSAGLALAHFALGFVPFVGGLIYLALWCAAVMKLYKLSLMRSVGVAVVQFFISLVLFGLLKLIGLDVSWIFFS